MTPRGETGNDFGVRPTAEGSATRGAVSIVEAARMVVASQWGHRCSDGVGGCTAVSAAAMEDLLDALLADHLERFPEPPKPKAEDPPHG